jgi:hypothetical protein
VRALTILNETRDLAKVGSPPAITEGNCHHKPPVCECGGAFSVGSS